MSDTRQTLSRTVILSRLLLNYITQDYTASVPLKRLKAFVFFSPIFVFYKDGHVQEVQALCRSERSYTLVFMSSCGGKEKKRLGIEREKQRGTEMREGEKYSAAV